MSLGRNGYPSVPTPVNQPNRTDSSRRFPTHAHGSRLQPPPNLLFGSDSVVHGRLPDPQNAHTVGPHSPNRYTAPSHRTRQIPIHDRSSSSSSLPPRQPNQIPRQTFRVHVPSIIPHPTTPERTSTHATQDSEDWVLERLKKVTYNPTHKNLLKSPSLRHKEQNHGGTVHTNMQNLKDEDRKRCAVCLEDFEPKETVMLTPCNHMFHEECIVRWVKSRGQCPVCRFVVCEPRGDSLPDVDPGHSGFMAANDLLALDLLSVLRALEESSILGYLRRRV